MQSVFRKQIVEGVKIPGIIHNLNYYYTDLALFSDGTFSCWEIVDQAGLERKIDLGWISLRVPDGNPLDVHHLGRYVVRSGSWVHDKGSYLKKIESTLVAINPGLENIYSLGSLHKSTFDDRKVLQSASPVDFTIGSGFLKDRITGNSFDILFKDGEEMFISVVTVYENGNGVLQFGERIFYQGELEGLKTLLASKGATLVESGSTLQIDDLGTVIIEETLEHVGLSAKLIEIDELFKRLTGQKTRLQKCREVYLEYLQSPDEGLRNELKESYEMIPEHERIYLGDMDTRDWDYRRILYSPNTKREV